MTPSGATLTALHQLRQASHYVVALADAVIVGADTNRHAAMPLIVPALHQLQIRTQAALNALAEEGR